MQKLAGYLGIGVFIAIVVAGFFAYFVTRFDPVTHTYYDGLGRRLVESPWLIRFIFGANRDWPGWLWFFTDFIIFWGGIGLGCLLVQFGFKSPSKSA